jgi:hypothetical protein
MKNMKEGPGLMKSVMAAYLVLVLHIVLIAFLGMLVLFFRGMVQYMLVIFLLGTGAILASAYHFYRRMKAQGKSLGEMLRSPIFAGKNVEISFLGGLASLKVGRPENTLSLTGHIPERYQLEDEATIRLRELNELVRLLEQKLITLEEYNQAKKQLFKT